MRLKIALRFAVTAALVGVCTSAFSVDCNRNRVDDSEDVKTANSEDCNQNGVPDECEQHVLYLGENGTLADLGTVGTSFAFADLDDDGDQDLVVATAEESSIAVYRNRTDEVGQVSGGLSRLEVRSVRSEVKALATADLDNDTRPDVVALLRDAVLVFFNEGEGALGEPVSFSLTGSEGLAISDMNGDGHMDLVVHGKSGVAIRLNRGDRTFDVSVRPTGGGRPVGAVTADVNGDGKLDIVTADDEPLGLSIFFNDGCAGGDEGCKFTVTATSLPGDRKPTGIRAGDLDNDGAIDLVVRHAAAVYILLNQGDGDSFDTSRFSVSLSLMELGDLDGDGDLDIVTAFSRNDVLRVLMNEGDGTFRSSIDLRSSGLVQFFQLGDFDGDQRLDVAVSTTTGLVSFLWNGREESVVFEQSKIRVPFWPHAAIVDDLDGDGDLDLVTGNGGARSYTIFLNDGVGDYSVGEQVFLGHSVHAMAKADFDRDGDVDMVCGTVHQSTITIFSNPGDGTYDLSQMVRNAGTTYFLATADFNGDGWADVVSVNEPRRTVSVFYNDGSGKLARRKIVRVGVSPRSAAPGDFDGDGDVDLAVSNAGSGDVSIVVNEENQDFVVSGQLNAGGTAVSILTADLNGDSHLDLAVGNMEGAIGVFLNRQDGSFDEVRLSPFGAVPLTMEADDIDGDGRIDIVTSNEDTQNVSVLLNESDGLFRLLGNYRTGGTPRYSPIGDVDNDGDIDILATHRVASLVTVLFNQSASDVTAFSQHICTGEDFFQLASVVRGATPGEDRLSVKYTVPAREDASLLQTVFQNTRIYGLHQQFLGSVFSELFPALTAESFLGLTQVRNSRDYYIGATERIRTDQGFAYIFSIVTAAGRDEALSVDEVRWIHEKTSEAFTLRPLFYAPDPTGESPLARAAAESWDDPGFPVYLGTVADPNVEFVPYTQAVGYGRVRLFRDDEFDMANESGRFTFQDIAVIDHSPRDIEGVVGGVVTAARQGALSHVSIRTARRGTPNAFVDKAMSLFAPFEGQLVRLEITEDEYTVREAAQEEAEAFWDARAGLPEPRPFDAAYRGLDSFDDVDFAGEVAPVARYGGKASGLARLQTILTGEYEQYRELGFAIPMAYYTDFMTRNTIPSEVDGRDLGYQEYLDELFTLEQFRTDSEYRFKTLDDFRGFARDNGTIPDGLVDAIASRVEDVFGSREIMVRHRSSSNVEDILDFNGAGLYESTSICVADSFDEDDIGPSLCDPTRNPERTIERALRKVWTSLWTFRAYEERSFFKIPQESAAMGILVNRSFLDETANGVAFTGDPTNPRGGCYIVTAQFGEESVVSPEPGVLPEVNTLEVTDGAVVNIVRSQRSTLAEVGEVVLSDEKLRELGALMSHIDANYPLDTEGRSRDEVLLDMEFKLEPDGSLAVKQIRPFLIVGERRDRPLFELQIPADTVACGTLSLISPSGSPKSEYESKSLVRFRAGTVELPSSRCVFSGELFEEVIVGPAQEVATPAGPGIFRVTERAASTGNRMQFTFSFRQYFSLPGGRSFEINVFNLEFATRGGVPVAKTLVFDEEYITFDLTMLGFVEDPSLTVTYSSCGYELLPRWKVEAVLEGGTTVTLDERFLPETASLLTGPASLDRAELFIGGQRRSITSYWDLVYSAARHNLSVTYWIFLDPPVSVPGVEGRVHILELDARDPPELLVGQNIEPQIESAAFLGENFEILARSAVVSYQKRSAVDSPFVRGDANGYGSVDISDSIRILNTLFRDGEPFSCEAAADANDDDRLNVSDAIWTLLSIFRGSVLPDPSGICGTDEKHDRRLHCDQFAMCGEPE